MFKAIARTFDFGGRSGRAEFWLFVLLEIIVGGGLAAVVVGGGGGEEAMNGVVVIISLLFFLPGLSLQIRRLHDIDWSGWWVLIGFIPLLNLLLLVVAFIPGVPRSNRFGPPASARGGVTSVSQPPIGGQPGASFAAEGDRLTRLEQLGRLRDQGVLTSEEFEV